MAKNADNYKTVEETFMLANNNLIHEKNKIKIQFYKAMMVIFAYFCS